jgi:hypothetical protein
MTDIEINLYYRPGNAALIAEHPSVPLNTRFDSPIWRTYNFQNETLKGRSDAHLIRPIYGANWPNVTRLLKLVFNAADYEWCEKYHSEFMKLA